MDCKGNELTLGGVFRTGWDLAKKHWLWLILLQLVAVMCNQTGSAVGQPNPLEVLSKTLEGDVEGVLALKKAAEDAPLTAPDGIGLILGLLLGAYVSLVTYRYVVRAVREEDAIDVTELIRSSLGRYGMYMVKNLLYYLVLFVSTLCLVLPGLYLIVRLQFVPLIAANEPELSIKETFARSMTLTRGRFWQLLGYGVASVCISIAGFLVLIVGALYTNVIVNLMQAHVFNVLSDGCPRIGGTTSDDTQIYVKTLKRPND